MQYKKYGKTGKKISVIGFGGMRFNKEDYEDGNYEQTTKIIHRANELGINYFDTAPFYCDDKSEEIFGHAFKNMPHDYYVSTKSSISKEKTADDVRWRIENSLIRLGVKKIDFFNMWCIMDLDQYRKVIAPGGPYEGALKAKEEGLIDHLVFSTHCTGHEIAEIVKEGRFEGVTLGYNATNFAFRQEGIKAAYEQGLGVITMNPLGGGIIPQNPDFYQFIRQSKEDTVAQSALKFNISHKEITCALTGMGTIDEVEENVKAGENFSLYTQEKLDEMTAQLSDELNSLCTGCGYCVGCPKEIEIPKMMDSYNLLMMTKKEERLLNHLKYHWNVNKEIASECIACGLCETKCTQHIPIIERLNHIHEIAHK